MIKIARAILASVTIAIMVLCVHPALAQGGSEKPLSDRFALGLFRKIAGDGKNNVVLSPFSAYQVLAMVLNGADGNTKAQIAKLLGVAPAVPASLIAFNKRNHDFLELLNLNEDVNIEIANAVFSDKTSPLKGTFVDLCRKNYFAEARSIDFESADTVANINKWCSEKTHGKIPSIIDSLNSSERLVLLNSAYFKGKWANPFKPKDTLPEAFHLLSGEARKLPMMHSKQGLAYLKEANFEAVSIAYAGRKQSMYIFLPAEGTKFAAFIAGFTDANWYDWTSRFTPMEINLAMPKYKLNFGAELNGPLRAMGMTDALSAAADFKKLFAAGNGFISRIVQKTFIEVSEQGTEAAASTIIAAPGGMMHQQEPEPINFRVDRPFVIAIVDSRSREILFLGSVVDPQ